MALTTDTALFGAIGVEDPEVFKTGIAIKRAVNFKYSNVDASVNYEFLPIPAGFVVTGVYAAETEKCTAGAFSLKSKNGGKAIGASVTVGGDELAKTFALPTADSATPMDFVDADMLCLVPTAKLTTGAIEVVLHGYLMNGGSLSASELTVPYRSAQTEAEYADNKSGGDLYLRKMAAGV